MCGCKATAMRLPLESSPSGTFGSSLSPPRAPALSLPSCVPRPSSRGRPRRFQRWAPPLGRERRLLLEHISASMAVSALSPIAAVATVEAGTVELSDSEAPLTAALRTCSSNGDLCCYRHCCGDSWILVHCSEILRCHPDAKFIAHGSSISIAFL